MNIQIQQSGKWYFLGSIHKNYFRTTADVNEALSADYLDIICAKYPNMNFRSI